MNNLFTQNATQSITATVLTSPKKNERPTEKLEHTWFLDVGFGDDGQQYTLTAWHNHESKPKLSVGDSVTVTAQVGRNGKVLFSLPRDCHK